MYGSKTECMKAIGNTIECTEKVKSAGSTEEAMKETTSTIRNMDTVPSYGQTVASM
jgi:hypothetical protein